MLLPVPLTFFYDTSPVVYARDEDGEFEVRSGSGPSGFDGGLGVDFFESETTTTTTEGEKPGQPLRLDSISIVDVSGTRLSGLVCQNLAELCFEEAEFDYVSVSVAGEEPASQRIGSQVLFVEEILHDAPIVSSAGETHVAYAMFLGHAVRGGWGGEGPSLQKTEVVHRVEMDYRFYGTWSYRVSRLAEALADSLELPELFDKMREREDVVPKAEMMEPVESVDLSGAEEVLEIADIEDEPLLCGSRLLRRAEAFWRYEGADVSTELDRIRSGLLDIGWEELDKSRSHDGSLLKFRMRRDTRIVEFGFEVNRVDMLVNRSWSQVSQGPRVEHVEGEALDPVYWLHYFDEPMGEELRAALDAAGAPGSDRREAFIANLASYQREELGLDD